MSESIRDAEAAVRELGALPVPTGSEFLTPELRATIAAQLADARPATAGLVASMAKAVRDVREHEHPNWEDLYCLNLVSFMGERMGPVLRRLLDAEARVAELEAAAYGDAKVRLLTPVEQIRHLHAAVAAQLARAGTLDRLLREAQARVAELEAALPSRFTATPAEVDAYLRTVLAEDTYLRFQQEIGAQALGEVVEDAQKVRASADNDGLYNADWREGWDDAIERVDPELCGPSPSSLVVFAEADGITRRIAPVQALREDEPAEQAPVTIYRAEHPDSGITLGHYGTEAAARAHCEATERRSWPTGTSLSFDWIRDALPEDDENGIAELVVTAGQNEESTTGYIVTALDVPSAYDEEADA